MIMEVSSVMGVGICGYPKIIQVMRLPLWIMATVKVRLDPCFMDDHKIETLPISQIPMAKMRNSLLVNVDIPSQIPKDYFGLVCTHLRLTL